MLLTCHLKKRHYYYQCDSNGLKPYYLHIQVNTQSSSDSKQKLHLEETDKRQLFHRKCILSTQIKLCVKRKCFIRTHTYISF